MKRAYKHNKTHFSQYVKHTATPPPTTELSSIYKESQFAVLILLLYVLNYTHVCILYGKNIYSIYVNTPEDKRILEN